jgi:hypothetical protein
MPRSYQARGQVGPACLIGYYLPTLGERAKSLSGQMGDVLNRRTLGWGAAVLALPVAARGGRCSEGDLLAASRGGCCAGGASGACQRASRGIGRAISSGNGGRDGLSGASGRAWSGGGGSVTGPSSGAAGASAWGRSAAGAGANPPFTAAALWAPSGVVGVSQAPYVEGLRRWIRIINDAGGRNGHPVNPQAVGEKLDPVAAEGGIASRTGRGRAESTPQVEYRYLIRIPLPIFDSGGVIGRSRGTAVELVWGGSSRKRRRVDEAVDSKPRGARKGWGLCLGVS